MKFRLLKKTEEKQEQENIVEETKKDIYIAPTTDLLTDELKKEPEYFGDRNDVIAKIEKCFKNATRDAIVVNVSEAPSFTRYKVNLSGKLQFSALTNMEYSIKAELKIDKDIIINILEDKTVGVDIPNNRNEVIPLKSIVESQKFKDSLPMTFALGKNENGVYLTYTLNEISNLIIGGSTGSGNTIGLNTMLISLLYNSSPDDLRIMLIDYSGVEFSIYKDLPHLLVNRIITDADKTVKALTWIQNEMERRYEALANNHVMSLKDYNNLPEVLSGEKQKLPSILIMIDNYDRLVNTTYKGEITHKLEAIASKSKAVGIHIVISTQKPSIDTLPGMIKLNIPTRISYRVVDRLSSRLILDTDSAERLTGNGDMLVKTRFSTIQRVQGCYISLNEISEVIKYIIQENYGKYQFNSDADRFIFGFNDSESTEDDEMIAKCLHIFVKTTNISGATIQRNLCIGFTKAMRLIETMCAKGYISEPDNEHRRHLLITPEKIDELFPDYKE